jgi:arsenite methyltransferase
VISPSGWSSCIGRVTCCADASSSAPRSDAQPADRVLDTVSWHATDHRLMDRVLAAWDRHLTHPALPRTLAAQLRAAGFEDVAIDAHPFATTELIPDAYGGSLVPLLEQYVAEQRGLSREDAKAWADDQRGLGERGEFFFTVTQFCFAATRR